MKDLLLQWFISLKHYARMCLFLSSPSSLPYSPGSIILTLLAYIVVGDLLLGEVKSLASIIVQIFLEVLILFAISFAVLTFTHKTQRLLQTLSALIGVSLIISLASLLIMSVIPDNSSAEQIDPVVLNINIALLLWNLAVISLIFKRAFEVRTIVAAFIAFNYFIFYEFVLLNFF